MDRKLQLPFLHFWGVIQHPVFLIVPTSAPTVLMRGAFVHDAFYQLMRMGLLPQSYREDADALLRKMCREDGMSSWRAWYVYHSLRKFGAAAAKTDNVKEIYEAP